MPYRDKEKLKERYGNDYLNRTYKRYALKFNKVKDTDIIRILDKVENKNDYVRTLIREKERNKDE